MPERIRYVTLAVLGGALAVVYIGAAATMPPGHAALAGLEFAIGGVELAWVAMLAIPVARRPAVITAAAVQTVLAAGWLFSRTVGLPGQGRLPVGELDVLCLIDELLALGLAVVWVRRLKAPLRWPLAPSQLAVALASMTLFAWGGGHAHGAGAASSAWAAGGHRYHFYCRLL